MKALALFGRSREPVTYEVRLEIDPAIVSDFDDWLPGHVREMLAFPGFQAATVYRARELTENNRAVRVVVYEVRTRRELDSYLHTHAARMRREGVKRFGTRFAASRRILRSSEYVLPEGLVELIDQQQLSGGLPICGNCHQPVQGRFCAHCGQEDRTFMLSLGELAYEFVGDLFNFDSRFFRTMWPLLFRPGLLTAEYLRGRRQHYLPPVRTYIFISLIFFFAAATIADVEFGDELAGEEPQRVVVDTRDLSPEQREKVAAALRETASELGLPEGALALPDPADNPGEASAPDAQTSETREPHATEYDGPNVRIDGNAVNVSGFGGGAFEERLERGGRAVQKNPRAFFQAMMQQIPTMMFVFLPLIALVLKLLYIGSSRYYVEHLIFTLHVHSAVFVILLLWLLFGELAKIWAPLQALSGWINALVWVYIPVYLYRSLRCVYGQGHFVTSVKFLLLFFAYTMSLATTFTLTVLYTMYMQA